MNMTLLWLVHVKSCCLTMGSALLPCKSTCRDADRQWTSHSKSTFISYYVLDNPYTPDVLICLIPNEIIAFTPSWSESGVDPCLESRSQSLTNVLHGLNLCLFLVT